MSADDALEHHSAHLNGIKQYYVRAGSGPAVMLLHGWPQTWYEWRHVMGLLGTEFTRFRVFVKASFRLRRNDNRGRSRRAFCASRP